MRNLSVCCMVEEKMGEGIRRGEEVEETADTFSQFTSARNLQDPLQDKWSCV